MTYVNVNRTFAPYAPDKPSGASPSLFAFRSDGLKWSDLLQKYRVVVLGEAASGKSEEFRRTTLQLLADGKAAFFLPIEVLCDRPLHDCLPPVGRTRLSQWQSQSHDAYFFLDSIDEARMNGKLFRDALRNLSTSIENHLTRARIFISSRPKDWKAISDNGDVESWLKPPHPAPKDDRLTAPTRDELLLAPILNKDRLNKKDEILTDAFATAQCVLSPLDYEQRKRIIESHCSTTSRQLEFEIERFGLAHLATRPGDLLMLIEQWQSVGRLDRREVMCERIITKKLLEKRSTDPLSVEKAWEGAKLVAAALTFSRTFSFLDGNQEPEANSQPDSIELDELLTSWSEKEKEALLRRGIFVSHSFGKLCFYHREAQEYLCAKWLLSLLENGCRVSTLDAIVFPAVDGIKVVNPLFKPVLAWLALWNDHVRNRINALDASILIDHGDPGSLSISLKGALLASYSQQMNCGNVSVNAPFSRFDKYCWLFADPALAGEIRTAWDTATDDNLRIDLLQMIEDGGVKDCVDIAEAVAFDPKERIGMRCLAANSLLACQASRSLKRLASVVHRQRKQTRADRAARLITKLYSVYINTRQLFQLIQDCPPPPKNVTGGFGVHIKDLWLNCPDSEKSSFVRRLCELILKAPFGYHRLISDRFRFLAKQLPSIANDFFRQIDLDSPTDESFLLLHSIARADRFDSNEQDLDELVGNVFSNREFKRAFLWKDCELARAQQAREAFNAPFFRVPAIRLIGEFDAEDLVWLKEDLMNKESLEDRRLALNLIVRELARSGRLETEGAELFMLLGDEELLHEDLLGYTRPPDESANKAIDADNEKVTVERAKQEQRTRRDWLQFRDEIVARPETLFDVKQQVRLIDILTNWLINKTGERLRYKSITHWQFLKDAFSEQVADNFQAALKDLWRRVTVNRPVRKGNVSNYLSSAAQAYAGICIEADNDPDWPLNLSDNDAAKAAQVGCESEFDYPEWLDLLIEKRAQVSVPALEKALRYEIESVEEFPFVILHRYTYQNPIPLTALPTIVRAACKASFGSVRRLESMIRIVLRCKLTSEQKKRIARRAAKLIEDCTNDQWVLKARYFSLWIAVQADDAILALKRWLESLVGESATICAVDLFGNGFGLHGTGFLGEFQRSADVRALEQLSVLAHRFVPKDRDPDREGHFTPTLKDEAQQGRNGLVSQLAHPPSHDGLGALLRLANEKELDWHRHWLLKLARSVAEQIADIECWTGSIGEFRTFAKKHFHPVQSPKELHELCLNVLSNVAFDLGHSDASALHLLELLGKTDGSHEKAVQNWIAEQLRLRSFGQFQVQRESVVANDNMPDIVLSRSSYEIAIEVKQADSWSVKQLVDAIQVQLGETYLFPDYRRHGILFLTNSGRKGWRHPSSGKDLGFSDLVAFLSGIAKENRTNAAGQIFVSVLGVDLTTRDKCLVTNE